MATNHARDYDGTDDKIVFSSQGDLSGDALTISAWVNLDVASPSNDYVIVMQDSGNTQYGIVMNVIATSRLLQLVRHGTTDYLWYATSDISYGSWVHLLITSDGGLVTGSATLYVNGSSVSKNFTAGSGSETAHTGSWVIGARTYDNNRSWDGKIGEVAVWNRVLTSGEISTLASTSPYSSATNIPSGLIFCEYPYNYTDLVDGDAGTLTGTSLADGPDLDYLKTSTKSAYLAAPTGTSTSSTKTAYLKGQVATSSTKSAYLSGPIAKNHPPIESEATNNDGTKNEYGTPVDPDGDLNITTAAAMGGSPYGLAVTIDDTAACYIWRVFLDDSGLIRVRFHFDPNSITMGSNSEWPFFAIYRTGGVYAGVLWFNYSSGYRLQASIVTDDGTDSSSYYTITDGPHWVEVELKRETTSSSNDGYFSMWVDDVLKVTLSGKDNYASFPDVTSVAVGMINGTYIVPTTSGTIYIDEIAINTTGYRIGDRSQYYKNAYLKGGTGVSSTKSAFVQGASTGTDTSDTRHAYLKGKIDVAGNKPAYLRGKIDTASNKSAYLSGIAGASVSKPSYLKGRADTSSTKYAYLRGSAVASVSKHAYLQGIAGASISKHAYLRGSTSTSVSKPAYVRGSVITSNTHSAFLRGGTSVSSTKSAYLNTPTPKYHPPIESEATNDDGTKNEYATPVDPDGDINVTTAAAMCGTPYGLAMTVDDTTAFYIWRVFDDDSGLIRVRFYFDPNSMTMGTNSEWPMFAIYVGSVYAASIWFNYSGSSYRLQQAIVTDTGGEGGTYFTISDGLHCVEVELKRATTSSSNDGYYSMWIDGDLKQTQSGKDNYDAFPYVTDVAFGVLSGTYIVPTTNGTFYIDELAINTTGLPIGDFYQYTKHAYLKGGTGVSSTKHAYIPAGEDISSTKHAYLKGSASTSATKSAYLKGGIAVTSSKHAYMRVIATGSSTRSAYIPGEGEAVTSSSKHAYLEGRYRFAVVWIAVSTDQSPGTSVRSAYLNGGIVSSSSKHAYQYGNVSAFSVRSAFVKTDGDAISSKHAYLRGGYKYIISWLSISADVSTQVSSKSAYMNGAIGSSSTKHAYLRGAYGFEISWSILYLPLIPIPADDSKHAYLEGIFGATGSNPAYLRGGYRFAISWSIMTINGEAGSSTKHAYLQGSPAPTGVSSSRHAYLKGIILLSSIKHAYIVAEGDRVGTKSAFLYGRMPVSSFIHAYIPSLVRSTKHAFMPVIRAASSSRHAYLYGYQLAGGSYIGLVNSDGSLSKSFYVLHEGYDDGTYNRTENISWTLAGATDVSLGEVYRTWSMVIKVRQIETEYGFGDVDDLEAFFQYTSPNGTPNTTITFIDHHQHTASVHLISNSTKQLMGIMVEGSNAWYMYKITFMEIPT